MCNHSAPAKVETTVKVETAKPVDMESIRTDGQRLYAEIERISKAKGISHDDIKAKWSGDYDYVVNFLKNPENEYAKSRNFTGTIPMYAEILGVQAEYLYLIGEGNTETMFPEPAPAPVKKEIELEAERLILEIHRLMEIKGIKPEDFKVSEGGYAKWENYQGIIDSINSRAKYGYDKLNFASHLLYSAHSAARNLGVTVEYLDDIATGKQTPMYIKKADRKTAPAPMPVAEYGVNPLEYLHRLIAWRGKETGKDKNGNNKMEGGLYSPSGEYMFNPLYVTDTWNNLDDFRKSLNSFDFMPGYLNQVWTGIDDDGVFWKKLFADYDAKLKADAAPAFKAKTVEEKDKEMKTKVTKKGKAKGKKKGTRILPAGIVRYVHVYVPALQERFSGTEGNPLCCVRALSNLSRRNMYSKVEFLGASELAEIQEPLPGTNGRGICVMITKGALRVHD